MSTSTNAAPARSQVSVAGQVNYWLRAALLVGMGLCFALSGQQRYRDNPSYSLIQDIMPIDAWGWLFFAFGAALTASWWVSLRVARAALVSSGYIFFLWAMVYLVQAIHEPRASTVAVVIYGFISATTFASTLYLPVVRRPRT